MAVHLYPVDTTKGPGCPGRIHPGRATGAEQGRREPSSVGHRGELRRPAGRPSQVVPEPQTAATYVARTYLDSATLGIARTYWYGWDLSVLGIDMVDANGITPAGTAFVTVRGG